MNQPLRLLAWWLRWPKLDRNILYQGYLFLISLAGLSFLVWGLWQFPTYPEKVVFLLLCGLAAVSAFGTSSITVEKSGITYAVGPAVSMAVIPLWGPVAATLLSTVFNLSLWLLKPKDQTTWKKSGIQLAFNQGMHALAFFIAGHALLASSEFLGRETIWGQTLPWLLAALIYNEVNIWLLIGVLRLQHGPSVQPWSIWREDRWASQISVLVVALGGGLLAFAVETSNAIGVMIFYLPIVLSAYAFRLYLRQMQAHMDNLEQIVAERTKNLAELNEQKDAYLAVLTHDMMTPLTSIQLCAEELAAEPEAAIENPYLARVLLESQKALLNIVRDILDIEKLQAGETLATKKDLCNLTELVRTATDIVQVEADVRGIHLIPILVEQPVILYADRRQMERILLNLVANAVKYTPSGGWVQVSVAMDEERAMVEVRDNGYGIPAEDLPHIFERFRRGSLSKDKASGAGLGLAITKALVEEHGGSISVQSELGQGSTFTLCLPLKAASACPLESDSASGAVS